jgi:hypothetical protein
MTDPLLRRNFINVESSVVPDTLIDLYMLQSLASHGAHQHSSTLFQSFHPYGNLPLTHTVIIIPNCHSSVHFTSFHTLWPQESITSHCSTLAPSINGRTHLHLVPRSIMRRTIPPLPQHAFMAWCSVKQQGQLYLYHHHQWRSHGKIS